MAAVDPDSLSGLIDPIQRSASYAAIARFGQSGAVQTIIAPRPRPPGLIPSETQVIDPEWLADQPVPKASPQLTCLAQALYFEARGEGTKGQAAVAEVILNRVESTRYPDTICGVVEQKGGGTCQFSFSCDGRPETIHEKGAYNTALRISRAMMDGAPRLLTKGATHFHTPAVKPGWSRVFTRTAKIGRHIFYRSPKAMPPTEVADSSATASLPAVVADATGGLQLAPVETAEN